MVNDVLSDGSLADLKGRAKKAAYRLAATGFAVLLYYPLGLYVGRDCSWLAKATVVTSMMAVFVCGVHWAQRAFGTRPS